MTYWFAVWWSGRLGRSGWRCCWWWRVAGGEDWVVVSLFREHYYHQVRIFFLDMAGECGSGGGLDDSFMHR